MNKLKELFKNPVTKIVFDIIVVAVILIIFLIKFTSKNNSNTEKYMSKENAKFNVENVQEDYTDMSTEQVIGSRNEEYDKYIQEKTELTDKLKYEMAQKDYITLENIEYNPNLTVNANNLENQITELVCYSETNYKHLQNVAVTEEYFNRLKSDKVSCLRLDSGLFYISKCGIADDDSFFAIIIDSSGTSYALKGQITDDKISNLYME